MSQKSSWPEVVGMTFDEASADIKRDNPQLDVRCVAEGTPVPRDFNPDRVFVYVNGENKVVTAPAIG